MIAVVSLAAAVLAVGAPLTASTSLEPTSPRFADRIVATATVVVDTSVVDPDGVRVVAAFGPLDVVAGPSVTRDADGARVELRYRWEVACLSGDCVPTDGARTLRLPPLRVSATARDGTRRVSTYHWPAVTISGRVTRAEAGKPVPPVRRETDLPPPAYRVSPRGVATALDAIAAVLLVVAALVGVRGVLRARRRRAAERFARLTPLERALLYAREAVRRDAADRRRALGLLGRVLTGAESALGDGASNLAWSASDPSPEEVAAMVGEVERGRST
jgi:hypothetical protein